MITRAMGRVFPQEWDRFAAAMPEGLRHPPLVDAYAALLSNPGVRERGARVVRLGGVARRPPLCVVLAASMDTGAPYACGSVLGRSIQRAGSPFWSMRSTDRSNRIAVRPRHVAIDFSGVLPNVFKKSTLLRHSRNLLCR